MSNFKVKARTLVHLGAELITTDTIALNELIKNSFDADSDSVVIQFNVPFNPILAHELASRVEQDVVNQQEAINILQQSLFGDLKSGKKDEILSRLKSIASLKNGFSVALRDFSDQECNIQIKDNGHGMSGTDLRDVFLVIGTPVKFGKKRENSAGNNLLGDKGIGRLSMMRLGRLSKVISSTADRSRANQIEFDWSEFENNKLFIDEISVDVRSKRSKEALEPSGTFIELSGLRSSWEKNEIDGFTTYLRRLQDPINKTKKRFPVKVYFNGHSQPIPIMGKKLKESAQFEANFKFTPSNDLSSVALSRELKWKGESTYTNRDWDCQWLCDELNIDSIELVKLGQLQIGCYWYNRSKLKHPRGEMDREQIREELNVWAGGFALYRDGFRIGVSGSEEGDWMRMGSSALRGTGYRMNNIQTVGSIAISHQNNPELVDTANREGLIDCPEYRLLTRLMNNVIIKDLKYLITMYSDAEEKKSITEKGTVDSVETAASKIKSTINAVNQLSKDVPKDVRPKVITIRDELKQHVDTINVVKKAIELAREQKVEILELAGVGMSVEFIAHELVRVTERTANMLKQLSSVPDEAQLAVLIDSIESQLQSINKRLQAIDPLSPSGRNRKVKFDLVTFINGILEGYAPRFERHGVDAILTVNGKPPEHGVTVRLVRGFVAQVLENIIANSMYWLVQDSNSPAVERVIEIDIDHKGRFIEVSDTGPGIDLKYKDDIFAPYFSFKKNGKGLGLYIARQLSEYHGGALNLSDATDADGRLKIFIVEFPKD